MNAVTPAPDEAFRLETRRLILRGWKPEDWPRFFEHTNTPQVMEWLGGVMQPDRMALQRQRIEDCHATYGHGFWVMDRKSDGGRLAGEMLGFCGLKRAAAGSPVTGEFEIGWRMRQDAWGHGFAREAAEASLAAGFERFGAQRIVALTVTGNEDSWGLMRRLGMERCSDLDHVELFWDMPTQTIVHALDREDWAAARDAAQAPADG